jgi:hypothetical protein
LAGDDLRPWLAPRSIAIVGASASNPYASRLLENLGNGGYTGRLYLINPRQASIGGLPCHPSIEALPETPDLAILVVPQGGQPRSPVRSGRDLRARRRVRGSPARRPARVRPLGAGEARAMIMVDVPVYKRALVVLDRARAVAETQRRKREALERLT